jgi:5'-phosphate synthase pdxT subunit
MILMARTIVDGRPGQEPLGLMDLIVRRNAYGRQLESFEAVVSAPALGGSGPAVFIRAPQVLEHGPQVEVLAEHRGHPVALREGNRLALAFHPELTPDRRWHQFFLGFDGDRK